MDKVTNQLFVNYNRPIGKSMEFEFDSNVSKFPSGFLHVFYEHLVPGSSDQENSMLTAMSNSMFIEARKHNMSLAPFGHFDPVKFALAGTFVAILVEDLLKDLSIIGAYSFGNVAYGDLLARACNIEPRATETEYANNCKKMNILLAKVNSLYIPITGFTKRWLEHRRCIYKDDEGDRYSLYLYFLSNYYELDVDPLSPNVGRLVYRSINTSTGIATSASFLSKWNRINSLVDAYLSDDDMVEFCTEALQANMPHLEFAMLKSTSYVNESGDTVEKFAGPELKVIYSLDDILGLENANFVVPSPVRDSGTGAANNAYTWDVFEDSSTSNLYCGQVGSRKGILPVFPSTGLSDTTDGFQYMRNMPLDKRPIFTHAKVKSLPGLTSLLRYVVALGPRETTTSVGSSDVAGWMYNGSSGTKPLTTSGRMGTLTVHGTEVLSGHRVYYRNVSTYALEELATTRLMNIIPESNSTNGTNLKLEMRINLGFKPRFASFSAYDAGSYTVSAPVIADFDYVVYLSQDSINNFFGANAWNDIQLIKSSELVTSGGNKSVAPEDKQDTGK